MNPLPDGKQKKKTVEEGRLVRSSELFLGGREVVIEHHRELYRLLITKSGKLILNK